MKLEIDPAVVLAMLSTLGAQLAEAQALIERQAAEIERLSVKVEGPGSRKA